MCTAATYKTKDFYMGRTLDYEFSYGEQITITPRNYEFDFRFAGKIKSHYALIGMAFVAEGYPLYYDAVNEKGLGMAGLNFVGNAAYEEALPEDETEVSQVAQFEFIPWILTQCATVELLDSQTCRFSADVYDASEILPWLRTFIGRIVDLKCSSQYVLDMFQEDLARMDALYGGGNDVIQ